MNEIVVISGKGGTGKTSLLASFAALAGNVVLADCDVDAADLHLLLAPTVKRREEFRCGREAVIVQEVCIRCGACLARCRFGAVLRVRGGDGTPVPTVSCKDCDFCVRSCPVKAIDFIQAMKDTCVSVDEAMFVIDPTACEGCGVCVHACPAQAIAFPERVSGEWLVSDTRYGPMVHARLEPGGENSWKLVSQVRTVAKELAKERQADWILADGPPGVGCPVIASVSGVNLVVVVTEPTVSGAHDLGRVLELTRHFGIPAAVCVNKWDINPEMTERIEAAATVAGASLAGRVRYDRTVTAAQVEGKTVVEVATAGAGIGADIRAVWERVRATLATPRVEAVEVRS